MSYTDSEWKFSTKAQQYQKLVNGKLLTIDITEDDDGNQTFTLREDGKYVGAFDNLFLAMKH